MSVRKNNHHHPLIGYVASLLGAVALAVSFGANAADFDEAAAKKLGKKNDCFKCHAVNKTKKGPSYKKVAEKFKGKPDAEVRAALIDNLTKEPMVKLDDGTEEKHTKIKVKDQAEMDNIIKWILAQ